MRELGLLQVYTGDGKGKTTAALGLCLRALGHDYSVLFLQFMKKRSTGEMVALQRHSSLVFEQYGSGGFLRGRLPTNEERERSSQAIDRVRRAFEDRSFDLVVLDEVSHAVNSGLIDCEKLQELLTGRAPGIEVILTGRRMPPGLIELADLVSEVHPVKHPFDQGIAARKGIEF